jgi:SAM-dependent methyltransferase
MNNHNRLYSNAEIYDIAFGFRDVPGECDFLISVCRKHRDSEPTSFLELAAGPALHTRELARRGLHACALDCAQEMVAYGEEQARQQSINIDYQQGDMVNFDLSRSFDLAAILMDSTSYLLGNDAVLKHLKCVADHLNPDGLYVLEMGHPKYVFDPNAMGENRWEMARDDTTVETKWGNKDDEFDPITQITLTTATVRVTRGEQVFSFEDTAPQRCFTATEFDALIRASGRFEVVTMFGAMDDAVPFDNTKKAWRMVPVLRRM